LGGFSHNIAEGSKASGTSKKMELKLTNVARASLEELKLDYEDFLRQRGLPLWPEGDPRRKALVARRCQTAGEVAVWVGETRNAPLLATASPGFVRDSRPSSVAKSRQRRYGRNGLEKTDGRRGVSIGSMKSMSYAEAAANAAHVLVGVACALLDRQIERLAADFEREGGFTERLYRIRSGRR
jgi:four helix bundle suffix protein